MSAAQSLPRGIQLLEFGSVVGDRQAKYEQGLLSNQTGYGPYR